MPFPKAFLPGDFIQPGDPNAGFGIRPLNRAQLVALSNAIGSAEFKSRTPDPQARRYEFKRFLSDDLDRLERNEALDNLRSLSELKTLIEGVIYGHLSIKMYDLRIFRFNVPDHLRYMGVLMDRQGRAFGGTDPDTLFFSSATPTDYGDLLQSNNQSRPSGDGARHLLLAFKQSIQREHQWDPDHILWMKALDRLFFNLDSHQNAQVDLRALRKGWRQIGPVNLRTSVTAGIHPFASYYLPVYETDYLVRALVALSGSVSELDDALQLTVNQVPVGRVVIPRPGTVAGASSLLLGAGNLRVESSSVQTTPRINYEQLSPKLRDILSIVGGPDPLRKIAEQNPFGYPDVIRIPIQYDGFVALQYLSGAGNSGFSQHFLDQMRGYESLEAISIPDQKQPPCLVTTTDANYFVDANDTGGAFYVEEFGGRDIGELKLLGYILWSIFDSAATVSNGGAEVKIGDKTVLTHTGERFEIARNLQCQWPNERVKAATLQRFQGLLNSTDPHSLFGAAAFRWLETGFPQGGFQPVQANHSEVKVGPYKWRTCTV